MIVFYELDGREYEEMGRVEDGEIVSGADRLEPIIYPPNLYDEERLLSIHDGPHVLAQREEEDGEEDVTKWLPFKDEDGNRAWISEDSVEVEYTDEPPGPVVKGFEEQADGWMDGDPLEKAWIPYQGPFGGEGWQNVETGEVRYVDEPPGPVQVGDEVIEEPREDGVPGMPDDEEDIPTDERDELTWENVQVGDEIVYYDKYGEMQEGEVTAVEQDSFGQIWVQQEEGGTRYPVEEEDFGGGVGELIGETVEVPESGATAEWMDNNLFYGQTVELHNRKLGEIQYGEIEDIMTAGGEMKAVDVYIEQEHGFGTTVTITADGINWGNDDDNERFKIRETETWDSLSEEAKEEALKQSFNEGVTRRNMSGDTIKKVTNQVHEEVIPSFRDSNVAREALKGLFKMENYVSRASCSGVDGYAIKVEEDSPLSTLHHEFGHGVVSSFGYNYSSGYDEDEYSEEKYRRRPTNLSHEYSDLSDRLGFVEFDFSEDSNFFDPEEYMLRQESKSTIDPTELEVGETFGGDQEDRKSPFTDTITPTEINRREDGKWEVEVEEYKSPVILTDDGEMMDSEESATPDVEYEGDPVGYDEWKSDIDGVEYPDLEERDYTPMGDKKAGELFEELESGDVVKFSVPSQDPPTKYLIFEGEDNEFKPFESGDSYEFSKPDGSRWTWSVNENGELNTEQGSFIAGYDTTRSEEVEAETESDVDHPLGHWDGFRPNPETAEDRIHNLVSAVNKSWYKQARQLEESSDTYETYSYHIGSGYSATNAHETMAMTHQVMQDGDTTAIMNVMDEHPWLAAAYLDVFEVPEKTEEKIRMNNNSDKYGIEL